MNMQDRTKLRLPRRAATEGMVLLKNEDKVLPLKKNATVALFGKGQMELIKGGTGSGDVKCEHVVGLLEGMEKKQAENKVSIFAELAESYKQDSAYEPSLSVMQSAAKAADAAIYIITRNSGEGSDRTVSAGDYYLADGEIKMIEDMISAGFQKIVIVLNVGGMVDTTKLLSYPQIKAILLAWQPGQDGGDAIADLLVGDVTPSGKLSDTFAKSYDDYPTAKTFLEHPYFVHYTEDIFIGYRYFETFDPGYSKVNFEFGFGLSYTTFAYSEVTFKEEKGELEIRVKVTNTGEYEGKEVVQLYFSAPQGTLGKAGKELCAFAKTEILAPGEAEVVTLRFDMEDLASYDDTGKVQKSAYVMEAGDYNFYLGGSIRLAGEAGVCYTYHVEETKVIRQLTEQMTAKLLPKRLLADGSYEEVYDDSGMATPIGTELVKLESEYCYAKHCHTQVVFNEDASNSGIQILTSDAGNRYVTFTVQVAVAGDYRVCLGIGNGDEAIENGVRFFVNGEAQESADLSIPATGGFWKVQEVAGKTLSLQEGLNFIHVEFVCGDKFKGLLDYMTLEGVENAGDRGTCECACRKASEEKDVKTVAGDETRCDADKKITFAELRKQPELMDKFLKQLSIEQLAYLLHGHGENVPHGTGSIGGLVEFGIPSAETADGPAGINLYENTTAWPVQTMMACTWNVALMQEVGEAIAAEAESYKVDIWLAPGVNIHRNPLCGRNFEYYSEDPYLSGMMASALINGVQGRGIGVMIKHFICNEKETNRGYSDSRVTERALRELYLRPFQIAIKNANPWAIMSSYNKVNGVKTAEYRPILTEVLRNEWNYDGVVSTDWWNDSVQYRELLAGQNLKMKSGDEPGVIGAYKCGILSRELLEQSVARILTLVMKTKAMERVGEDAAMPINAEESTTLRSIDCAWRSSEVGMEVCKDENGTYNTTNTYAGQWIVYLINVKKSGSYKVDVRVASPDGMGATDFFVDDKKAGNFSNSTKTGGWQNWATSEDTLTLEFTEGNHQLKLAFTQGGFNINTITLTPQ